MRAAQRAEERVWEELEARLTVRPDEIFRIASFWRSLQPHGPTEHYAVERAFNKAIRWGFLRRRERGEYVFTEIIKLKPDLLQERRVMK